MGYMSDYYASKDEEYDRAHGDDRSLMQVYLDSKDAEDD